MAVMQLLQNNIEDLLYNYRVNIAFSGHLHEIQRQSAVYRGEVVQAATMIPDLDIPNGGVSSSQEQAVAFHDDPQATVYMVIGTAGNHNYLNTILYVYIFILNNELTFLFRAGFSNQTRIPYPAVE